MGDTGAVHIVDDDEPLHRALQRLLRSAGYTAITYGTAAAIIDAAPRLSGCLLLDLRMPDMGGLEVQAQLVKRGVRLPVIVVTGHGDVSSAVQAMKAGALDFIEKQIDEDRLLAAIEAAFREGHKRSGISKPLGPHGAWPNSALASARFWTASSLAKAPR